MGHLGEDLRVALRRFRHQPGFTAVVVLTLAIGLGANTAIFALVDTLLIRSLPVERPDELYRIGDRNTCCVNSGLQGSYSLFSFRLMEHLRTNADAFTELAAFQAQQAFTVGLHASGRPRPEALNGQFVTGNYFRMFGVGAAAGRVLQPDDDRPGASPVVVLSYRAWVRLGLDPGIVGTAVTVNGTPMTVAGVAASPFYGDTLRPDPTGVWIPLAQEPAMRGSGSLIERADQDWLYAIGRLRTGASPEQASTRMTAALQQWLTSQPFLADRDRTRIAEQRIVVTAAGGGVQVIQRQFANPLSWLFLASAVLLLIATANLANLLLARADRGQVAIRAALGATGGRLMRQAMTEGIVLAVAGAVAGLVVAPIATRALIGLAFPTATFVPVDATPSPTAILFAFGLAIVTGMLFTGGPAWAMSRTAPLDALSGVGRSAHDRSFVPRRSLVIAQVALSFAMIASAGLLAASLDNLERQPLGFMPDERLAMRIDPPAPSADDPQVRALFYSRLRERLQRVPGVGSVSYALYSPMEGDNWSSTISVAGRTSDPARPDSSSWNRVGPGYFDTVGTRVLRGRAIDDRDVPGARRVAVVNQAFVRQFMSDTDPVGQHAGIGDASHAQDFEIVGVVEDVKYSNASRPVQPMMFLPGFQAGEYQDASARNVQGRSMMQRAIVVRTTPGAANIEPALRSALAEVDPNINVLRVLPMATQVRVNFRVERLLARLTSLYGLLALALACLGLYGVTTYSVAQRRREIGVRIALGADRRAVMRSVVGAPLVETLGGLVVGVPLALVSGSAISAQLYGLGGQDPWVLGIAVMVLLVTTAIAAAIPAMRAATVDPVKALRG